MQNHSMSSPLFWICFRDIHPAFFLCGILSYPYVHWWPFTPKMILFWYTKYGFLPQPLLCSLQILIEIREINVLGCEEHTAYTNKTFLICFLVMVNSCCRSRYIQKNTHILNVISQQLQGVSLSWKPGYALYYILFLGLLQIFHVFGILTKLQSK